MTHQAPGEERTRRAINHAPIFPANDHHSDDHPSCNRRLYWWYL